MSKKDPHSLMDEGGQVRRVTDDRNCGQFGALCDFPPQPQYVEYTDDFTAKCALCT
ncbi:hypothetical protein [Bradyrhizobium japonicum]|uniref:hypothetical protein n=1 Tax=Bradyrhizobium japonicum TaxID=375 RepID=UPI001E3F7DBA|nr:hypothetical protein [Bradyrhizobium japonicum]MCD9817691.1 hypothetical protein [Bradyrhizobium japonicum]MEB2672466.1 hypothetical protein [Bradyrhizobium japonicum]WRI91727.1 hypothetical protein R3F75_12700 [Bradyrhizobium japonicum]